MIKNRKRGGILLIFIIISALTMCNAVMAHPGHGTPIVEPSDPGTSNSNTGSSSSGKSNTGSSGSTGSSQISTSSSSASNNPSSTSGGTQSHQTDVTDSQPDSLDNTGIDVSGSQGASTGSVDIYGSPSNAIGGPAAMIGLIVVVGLVAMSFPYKKGGLLRNLQIQFFG